MGPMGKGLGDEINAGHGKALLGQVDGEDAGAAAQVEGVPAVAGCGRFA